METKARSNSSPDATSAPPTPVAAATQSSSIRRSLFLVGLVVWILTLLFRTGLGLLSAAWIAALFVAELLVLTLLTRTMSVRSILSLFMLGSGMFGVAWIGGTMYAANENGHATALHYVLIPAMEEFVKFVPLIILLWLGRKQRTWTYGASDLLLAGAAIGAGFAFTEDAYLLHRLGTAAGFGRGAHLQWFPSAAVEGGRQLRYIAGHGIWTGLAGLALGVAIKFRHRKLLAWTIGASGLAWALLDHIRTNYTNHIHDSLANFLIAVTGSGVFTLWLFAGGVLFVIGLDVHCVLRNLPPWPEFRLRLTSPRGFADAWKREINRRSLGYLVYGTARAVDPVRSRLAKMTEGLVVRLYLEKHQNDRAR